MKKEQEDELIKALKRNKEVQTDKESVLINQMKFDALARLADPEADIFSQMSIEETHIFEVATLFAHNPCTNINSRLQAKLKELYPDQVDGDKNIIIPKERSLKIELPILEEYIYGLLAHRLRVDRKRVEEYLKGMEAITPKMNEVKTEEKKSIFQRLT